MLNKLSILSVATIASITINQGLAYAGFGDGGSTGWNAVSSNSWESCANKALEKMKTFVNNGDVQFVPGWKSRFKIGNTVILNVLCSPDGNYVTVSVFCINDCSSRTIGLRKRIGGAMNW